MQGQGHSYKLTIKGVDNSLWRQAEARFLDSSESTVSCML